jgi:hypothetical protein
MKVDINHPSFISFLDDVSNYILSNISIDNYFSLSHEKKMGVLDIVFKLMENYISFKINLLDLERKSFVTVLLKKNEELENYEFAAILNDITNNFDAVNLKMSLNDVIKD